MDTKTAFERVKTYSDEVRKYFSVKRVILYGSYAKGRPRKHSDIDVAVVLSDTDKDFLTSETKLFQLRRDVDPRIEPVLFLEGDEDRSGFLEEIMTTGVVIYSADGT
jgi:predicted nucleotidyltransferase